MGLWPDSREHHHRHKHLRRIFFKVMCMRYVLCMDAQMFVYAGTKYIYEITNGLYIIHICVSSTQLLRTWLYANTCTTQQQQNTNIKQFIAVAAADETDCNRCRLRPNVISTIAFDIFPNNCHPNTLETIQESNRTRCPAIDTLRTNSKMRRQSGNHTHLTHMRSHRDHTATNTLWTSLLTQFTVNRSIGAVWCVCVCVCKINV